MGISVNTLTPYDHMFLEAKGDLLVYTDFVNPPMTATSVVLRRKNGVYEHAVNISTSYYASTNGKFIASYFNNQVAIYSLDENNQLSAGFNFSNILGGILLSDNLFVGLDSSDDGNYTLRTYELQTDSGTWIEVNGGVEASVAYWQGPKASFCVAENRLVVVDNITDPFDFRARIFELQTDKSWKFIDSVSVNTSLGFGRVAYNGVDTIVYSLPDVAEDIGNPVYGLVYAYTKVNDEWIAQKFSGSSVGYQPISYFGYFVQFADVDTLLISAAYEGNVMTGFTGGKILVLKRNLDGSWKPEIDLISTSGIFGVGLAITDDSIIAAAVEATASVGLYISLYSTPRCFYKPLNVTCNNQQIDDCSNVAVEDLFTHNNPECGAVSAAIRGFSLIDNKAVEAQVMLQKNIVPTIYCNVTVTCPAPKTPLDVSSASIRYFSFATIALANIMFM
jgi:hypothetical protein